MTLRLRLIIAFSILTINSFSQDLWRDGVLTTADGDKLVGQIRDLEWNSTPKEIEFRENGQQQIRKIKLSRIRFLYTDRPARYEVHYVEFDSDSQEASSLPITRIPSNLTKETLMLRVVVDARIKLLATVDSHGRKHFFLQQDSLTTELLYRKYKESLKSNIIFVNETYKQQLIVITRECPSIQQKIIALKYNQRNLSTIFESINECKGNEIIIPSIQTKKRSSFGLVGTAFISSIYIPPVTSSLDNVNGGLGIFYEIYSRQRPNRISFYNELLMSGISQPAIEEIFRVIPVTYKSNKIQLNNSIRLSYSIKGVGRYFWNIGITNGIRTNEKIEKDGNTIMTENGFELFGLMIGAGMSFDVSKTIKLTPELRFDYYNSPFELQVRETRKIGLNLQVGFR